MSASKWRHRPSDPRAGLVGWQARKIAGTVHVVPLNDLYEHTLDGSCRCGVHCEGNIQDYSDLVWVHDSFDGREQFDEFGRKRS